MAKGKHVVPHKGGWAVRRAGIKRVGSQHRTQQQAVRQAQKAARQDKSEVVVHGRDGKIRDKDSYGNDPCPPKETKH